MNEYELGLIFIVGIGASSVIIDMLWRRFEGGRL